MNQLSSKSAPAIRFIEFVGLPGSGKSTIADCLVSDLKRHSIETVSRSVELADHAPFFWRHCRRMLHVVRNVGRCGGLYLGALKLIADTGQKSLLDLAKVTWNFWSVIAFVADRRTAADTVTIIDQGLFQAIWSVKLSSSKELSLEIWNDLLSAAGITDILVVNVQSEIPVASNRLSARATKGTRLNSAGEADTDTWRTAAENVASIMHFAQTILPPDQCGKRIITIESDTTGAKAAAAEIAAAYLSRTRPAERLTIADQCCDI